MPGSEGPSGSQSGQGSSSGSSGPMSSGQLPDIGGGGTPGTPDSGSGPSGAKGESGQGGEETASEENGSGGSSGLPTGNGGAGDGLGSEWEKGSELPELPVDITAGGSGSGNDPDGVPGKKSGAAGDLEDALKDIDGGIMAERKAIKDRAAATPGGAGSGRRSDTGLPGSGSSDADGATGVGGTGGNSTNPGVPGTLPDGIPTMAKAPNAPPRTAGIPDDVADARDDDVVARQLREAAMAETDPEIRAKLWADYQKYKRR